MNKTDKELAVELSIAIIQNLGKEPIVGNDGKLIDVQIKSIVKGCYDAINRL